MEEHRINQRVTSLSSIRPRPNHPRRRASSSRRSSWAPGLAGLLAAVAVAVLVSSAPVHTADAQSPNGLPPRNQPVEPGEGGIPGSPPASHPGGNPDSNPGGNPGSPGGNSGGDSGGNPGGSSGSQGGLPNPILFVTQFPIAADFATIGSTFANHRGNVNIVGRGGDLYIRYGDGTLRNLTREAGYGEAGVFQGASSIAVRDPHVHWSGDRALFSMVVGAAEQQFEVIESYWQIYEASGLGQAQTAVITKIPNQPDRFNNITPIYSPDGRIVFTSDRPRNGARHLYPQHDEYESTATNTGLWSLHPNNGGLRLLNHTPSGAFTPTVDSYGRIIFTRWDHLQRDQQADGAGNPFGAFNWAHEGPNAPVLANLVEHFPEPRAASPGVNGLRVNHFFPWQIHPDGTEEETLNHIGRHELHDYFNLSFTGDGNLEEFIASVSGRFNSNSILNFFQIEEDPVSAGTYFGVEAAEFGTHASGQIVSLVAPPSRPADQIAVTYVTHPDTETVVPDGGTPPTTHSGHYRDPLPISDGRLIAAHTFETRGANNDGTRANPQPRYDFRLRLLAPRGGYQTASDPLTGGIVREIQYWDPDVLVSYTGPLWEMSPVEVRSRPAPPVLTASLPSPEQQIFTEEAVDPAVFRADIAARGLALTVSRDVTTRDTLDRQQPFNVKVAGSSTQTTGAGGLIYEVAYMQFFQGDQVRGLGGAGSPRAGRRVIAMPMHDAGSGNVPSAGPPGSVTIASDGSMAALVPARRAMTWQMTDAAGDPVIRERYWLTFQPGEIRVCTSCHGLNSEDQAGQVEPTNPPEALRQLLQRWKTRNLSFFLDGFEAGNTTAWTTEVNTGTNLTPGIDDRP